VVARIWRIDIVAILEFTDLRLLNESDAWIAGSTISLSEIRNAYHQYSCCPVLQRVCRCADLASQEVLADQEDFPSVSGVFLEFAD
jgi:hypothetical protein